MAHFEYKVIPAPRRGKRVKGAKTPAARFAHVLEGEMNMLALDGWEYVRSETLPVDERSGMFSGRVETYQTMLVFRRDVTADPDALLDQPISQRLPVDPPIAADGDEEAAPIAPERKQPLFRSRREDGTAEDAPKVT